MNASLSVDAGIMAFYNAELNVDSQLAEAVEMVKETGEMESVGSKGIVVKLEEATVVSFSPEPFHGFGIQSTHRFGFGTVVLDAGVWISGDPCYGIDGDDRTNYMKLVDALHPDNGPSNNSAVVLINGHQILVSSTGWGDGICEGFVSLVGRTLDIFVDFGDEDDE